MTVTSSGAKQQLPPARDPLMTPLYSNRKTSDHKQYQTNGPSTSLQSLAGGFVYVQVEVEARRVQSTVQTQHFCTLQSLEFNVMSSFNICSVGPMQRTEPGVIGRGMGGKIDS